jgi:hypothetical protein
MSTTTKRDQTRLQKLGRRGIITFSLAQIEEASELNAGYCLNCGQMQEQCEPDAREYRCDNCTATKVFGAEEIVIMGLMRE